MKKHFYFGIQLWTLKEAMQQDPPGTLQQLAQQGYTYIESFEGPSGMCWGMAPTEYAKFLANLGLTPLGAHCDVFSDFERKLEQASQAGFQYLFCPWLGPQADASVYLKAAETFNRCGELAQKAGIRLGYHHHDYSFVPHKGLSGLSPLELFMQRTEPGLFYFEMDLYWVFVANQDPDYWLSIFPGRWNLVHLKDRAKNRPKGQDISVELGKGSIDFPGFLAKHGNTFDYLLVEQEVFEGTTPLDATASNAAYMRKMLPV